MSSTLVILGEEGTMLCVTVPPRSNVLNGDLHGGQHPQLTSPLPTSHERDHVPSGVEEAPDTQPLLPLILLAHSNLRTPDFQVTPHIGLANLQKALSRSVQSPSPPLPANLPHCPLESTSIISKNPDMLTSPRSFHSLALTEAQPPRTLACCPLQQRLLFFSQCWHCRWGRCLPCSLTAMYRPFSLPLS